MSPTSLLLRVARRPRAPRLDARRRRSPPPRLRPTDLGQNSTHQPTNYSVWRWSTTGGHNATMVLSNGSRGTQVDFGVGYCEYNASGGPGGHNPYPPTHDVFGCYRSELSLQRAIQDMVIDWQPGVGSSVRWFGLALLLPKSYAWDARAQQRPVISDPRRKWRRL